MICLTAILQGYFLGSFPTGYLLSIWFAGIDLRLLGSGSTGATNVLRHIGLKASILVFLADVLKGAISVLLPQLFFRNEITVETQDWYIIMAGVAALIGHIWPIWLKGRGGKAVATSFGVLLGLKGFVALACLGIFLTCFSISRTVSISSLLAGLTLPILIVRQYAVSENILKPSYLLLSILTSTVVLWRHRDNIRRLAAGIEPQIKLKNN
ncbi:MAG TPA: glycerol-3-phosphate 1-O-acyltransferase PlsY [Prochlorococcaceae cyanobacterium AMR_MDS_5431]|nr:glycerol-3-phosphate 1-O-acyltransferase PlsY [Prochlorococcaceae cyanobacterium AMR_MDS_5431]